MPSYAAEKLGERVGWIKGDDVAEEIARYAQSHNVTKIVMGKPRRFGFHFDVPEHILTPENKVVMHPLEQELTGFVRPLLQGATMTLRAPRLS